jgi:hypothetical protein
MADLKISQLPAATTPLAGTEVLPIVQSGTTKQATITNVLASAASLGANTFTAAQEWATGTAVASASTINLNTTTGNRVHITGTTTITTVTLTRGPRTLVFDGVLTLTHNSTTNNLPGGANITTAAGDRAIYESDGTTVYCVSYIKASGLPVVVPTVASGMTLLSTVTASTSATVDIETTFDSTYDAYLIVASGLTFNGGGGFYIRLKIGGSYATSGYEYAFQETPANAPTVFSGAGEMAGDKINLGNYMTSGTNDMSHYQVSVYKPTDTTHRKYITYTGVQGTSATVRPGLGVGGYTAGNQALTGVRFYKQIGDIVTGSFRLYGLANS